MHVEAKVIRSGDWWAIEVPAIPGLFSQAHRLGQVADQVIDAAALLGVDVTSVEVDVQLDRRQAAVVDTALSARRRARKAESDASLATRVAIQRLRGGGLTIRDVASVMELSPQRVSVLDREGGE